MPLINRQDIARAIQKAMESQALPTAGDPTVFLRGDGTWAAPPANTGPQGIQGIQGIQGMTGAAGTNGVNGLDGAQPDDLLALINYAFSRIVFLEQALGINYNPEYVPEQVSLLSEDLSCLLK
jgi:hypothetical protein